MDKWNAEAVDGLVQELFEKPVTFEAVAIWLASILNELEA